MITMGILDIVKPLLVSHHKIVGIIECASRNSTKHKSGQQRFYDIAKLVYSKLKEQPLHFKDIAISRKIPYYYMNNGSDSKLRPNLNQMVFISGQSWDIEEYESCDMYGYKPGKIYKAGNQNFVACRDGKIYLKIKFNLKQYLLNLGR